MSGVDRFDKSTARRIQSCTLFAELSIIGPVSAMILGDIVPFHAGRIVVVNRFIVW